MLHLRLDLHVSHKGLAIKKRTAILIALAILILGLVGTGLSTLYEQNEQVYLGTNFPLGLWKISHGNGFPLWWYGYSFTFIMGNQEPFGPVPAPPMVYWFSLESLVLDAAFWFAISFFVCVASTKSVEIILKTTASKVVATYFLASASFSIVGLSLFFFSYEDLGLRLYAIGLFLIAATFYQSLVGERRTSSQRLFGPHTSSNST